MYSSIFYCSIFFSFFSIDSRLYIGAPKGDKTSFTNSSADMTIDRLSGRVQMCSTFKCEDIRVGTCIRHY